MAVEVYVWLPARVTNHATGEVTENIGHASIKIGSDYLSFWPTSVRFDLTGLFPVQSAFNNYSEDVKSEGGVPDHTISLKNLNENEMTVFYNRMISVRPAYWARGFNCAGPVKVALYHGSGGKSPNFKVVADRRIYDLPQIGTKEMDEWARQCWTPYDVYRYAEYLRRAIG
ncbi:MAG: hypothetical protein R2681_17465 [Pyrinomonadaceae bacterium]